MEENRRRHYRVAQKEIYEAPDLGMYVTKEEAGKCLIAVIALMVITWVFSFIFARR